MRKFEDQFGFVTIAQNGDIDYLQLAYEQAKNIKATQKFNSYAVIVDQDTLKQVTDEHRAMFDYVIELPEDYAQHETWKQSNEWQVFRLTPFKETIKLESDLLFTCDISHWLSALRMREVCFSYHCRDYQGNIITDSIYRKLFENNDLPDIYTGMYYFRYSQTATNLFQLAKSIYTNWEEVYSNLIRCDKYPSTDVVFALAVKIIGIESCTIPTLDFFNFVHMKSGIHLWDDTQPWTDYVNVEQSDVLRINNINQYQPVHYYEKNFIS